MYKCIIPLVLVLTPDANGENLIRSLWNSVKNNQNDLSESHSNITKVGNMFYYYKLKPDRAAEPTKTVTHSGYDHEAIAAALAQQNASHPDNKPLQSKIDSTPETAEPGSVAEMNDKQIMYGDDGSPLQDGAVAAAWDRAEQAKRRLEEHREYMERVRKSRKTVEQSKRTTAANQTSSE